MSSTSRKKRLQSIHLAACTSKKLRRPSEMSNWVLICWSIYLHLNWTKLIWIQLYKLAPWLLLQQDKANSTDKNHQPQRETHRVTYISVKVNGPWDQALQKSREWWSQGCIPPAGEGTSFILSTLKRKQKQRHTFQYLAFSTIILMNFTENISVNTTSIHTDLYVFILV